MESLFLYLSATSANVVPSFRLPSLRGCEDPRAVPRMHTLLSLQVIKSQESHPCSMKTETKRDAQTVSLLGMSVWVPADSLSRCALKQLLLSTFTNVSLRGRHSSDWVLGLDEEGSHHLMLNWPGLGKPGSRPVEPPLATLSPPFHPLGALPEKSHCFSRTQIADSITQLLRASAFATIEWDF